MTRPIIRADKHYRRKMLLLYVFVVCLGGIVIGWGLPWAERVLREQDPKTLFSVIRATLFVMLLSLAAPGVYFLRLGRRIMEEERFPLPNQKVLKDTWIKLEKNSEKFNAWQEKKWVRVMDRIVLGKRAKDAQATLAVKTKFVRNLLPPSSASSPSS